MSEAGNIIVSIASYKDRFRTLRFCYGSILRQSMVPDALVLNIEECDIEYLPKEILSDIDNGTVRLNICTDNIRSHNKYFYVMREHTDSIVITVDDDMVYNHYTIESLYNCYKCHRDCVCCIEANNIVVEDGKIRYPYDYKTIDVRKESFKNIAIGGSGTLYPPDILRQDFSIEEITRGMDGGLSPYYYDDDLYLKVVETRNDVRVIEAEMLHGPQQQTRIFGMWKNENALYRINDRNLDRFYFIDRETIEKIQNG